MMGGAVRKGWGRSQPQFDDVVNTVRRGHDKAAVRIEADPDGGDCLGEMCQGVDCRLIGWQLIDQMHPRLVFDRPWDVRGQAV